MLINIIFFIILVEDYNLSKGQDELGFSEDIIKDLKGLGLDK
jgi:hypothetical protein